MGLEAFEEFAAAVQAAAALPIPWKGKTYQVPEPSPMRKARLAALLDSKTVEQWNEARSGQTVQELALSPAIVKQMDEDDVGESEQHHLAMVAALRFARGEAAANLYIARTVAKAGEATGEPERPKARPSRPRTGKRSAAASTTKRRASTSGTSSPTTST